jgi:RNA polymerase sigma-70 factor (ECF subfamily)
LIKKVATNNKLREDVFYKSQKSHCTTEDDMILAEYEIAKKTAIGQLPPKRKIIFEMSRNEEKSYNEISKELNISVNTVKVQMSKALASIRYFLQTESDITLLVAFFFM